MRCWLDEPETKTLVKKRNTKYCRNLRVNQQAQTVTLSSSPVTNEALRCYFGVGRHLILIGTGFVHRSRCQALKLSSLVQALDFNPLLTEAVSHFLVYIFRFLLKQYIKIYVNLTGGRTTTPVSSNLYVFKKAQMNVKCCIYGVMDARILLR